MTVSDLPSSATVGWPPVASKVSTMRRFSTADHCDFPSGRRQRVPMNMRTVNRRVADVASDGPMGTDAQTGTALRPRQWQHTPTLVPSPVTVHDVLAHAGVGQCLAVKRTLSCTLFAASRVSQSPRVYKRALLNVQWKPLRVAASPLGPGLPD